MQKPTKAFADMVLELADKLEAVLNEMYPDGQLIPVFVSPESLRASARDLTRNAEDTQRSAEPSLAPSRFAPLYPVTLYQAGCTSCGAVVDDYGDYSCLQDDEAVGYVCDRLGWFETTRSESTPTPEMPNLVTVHTVELLCPDCQRCEVCGAMSPAEIDEHLVCVEHEDYDFSDAPIDVSEVGS